MDLYLLDSNFRPSEIIENYDSLIWSERFTGPNDFELKAREFYLLSERLKFLNYIGTSESSRIMMVETVTSMTDSDGDETVTIKGRSIESFLAYRNLKSGNNREPRTITQASAGHLICALVQELCVDSSAIDRIAKIEVAPAPADGFGPITLTFDRGDLLSTIQSIAKQYGVDFGIRANPDNGQLTFYTYNPLDCSDPDSEIYKEFSREARNLIRASSLESIANYANHARVLGAKAAVDVYIPGTSPTVTGFERRTIIIEAPDIGPDDTTTVAQDREALKYRGLSVLLEDANRYIYAIDGEIPQNQWNDTFVSLGDIVVVKDKYQNRVVSRVSELIYSSDREGWKITPTFQTLS